MSSSSPTHGDSPSLDASLQERIEAFAREAGLSPSEVMRRAFDAYAETHDAESDGESVEGILRASGLIGCLHGEESSPRDLSTNPIHMEGFGNDASGRR